MSKTKYVKVNYEDERNETGFTWNSYTYIDGTDGLILGDLVIAPTSKGESVARVCAINVPDSQIDERIMPLLKTITTKLEIIGEDKNGQ
jgi:hypothetical protein